MSRFYNTATLIWLMGVVALLATSPLVCADGAEVQLIVGYVHEDIVLPPCRYFQLVHWYINDTEYVGNKDKYPRIKVHNSNEIVPSSIMIISNATLEDSGWYKCWRLGKFEPLTQIYKVEVNVKNAIFMWGYIDEITTFECRISNYEWSNGNKYHENDKKKTHYCISEDENKHYGGIDKFKIDVWDSLDMDKTEELECSFIMKMNHGLIKMLVLNGHVSKDYLGFKFADHTGKFGQYKCATESYPSLNGQIAHVYPDGRNIIGIFILGILSSLLR